MEYKQMSKTKSQEPQKNQIATTKKIDTNVNQIVTRLSWVERLSVEIESAKEKAAQQESEVLGR